MADAKILTDSLALAGVMVGAVGTYLMTSAYDPFAGEGLFKSFLRIAWWAATFRWKKIGPYIDDTVFFAEINPERRSRSLTGIHLLLLSFLMQSAGAVITLTDDLHWLPK